MACSRRLAVKTQSAAYSSCCFGEEFSFRGTDKIQLRATSVKALQILGAAPKRSRIQNLTLRMER